MSSKDSPLKRRLEDLERELSAVNREVKSLTKDIGRGVARPSRQPPARPGSQTQGEARGNNYTGELFGSADRTSGRKSEEASPLSSEAVERLSSQERAKLERNPRFANYFVSGSVDGIRPLRHERRIQRNKAITMIIVVLLVLLGVLYLIF